MNSFVLAIIIIIIISIFRVKFYKIDSHVLVIEINGIIKLYSDPL